MKNDLLKNLQNGLIIGSSMLLPGVSGGTMAIILGVYDNIIHCVSSLKQDFKTNGKFLLQIGIGAIIGILLFSNAVYYAVTIWEIPMLYLFMGAIIGSIPTLLKKSKIKGIGISDILFIIIGLSALYVITLIPEGTVGFEDNYSITNLFIIFTIGVILSIALVLPGISASHMLLLFGIYETTIKAIGNIDLLYLVPISIGVLVGVFITTKTIERLMQNSPRRTYLVIIGFILASLVDIFPGVPNKTNVLVCSITFIIGFFISFTLSIESNSNNK